MKNIKLFSAALLSILFIGCDKEESTTGKSNLEVATGVTATISLASPLASSQTVREADGDVFTYTITLDKTQPVDIHISISQVDGSADDHDFEFDSELVIPAYSTTATGTVTILNDDEEEDEEFATLRIGGPNTSNASLTSSTITFVITDCYSDLAGTYSYTTTNVGEPGGFTVAGPLTGSVTFTADTPGYYTLSDASFGGWLGLYGPGNIATGVQFKDICKQLSYEGVDQFNEVFTISNLEILGSSMSFHWENDYGEYGDTTLTRTDGTDWPALFL